MTASLHSLHALYLSLTGIDMPINGRNRFAVERAWYEWLQAGLDEADLRRYVKFRREKKWPLAFHCVTRIEEAESWCKELRLTQKPLKSNRDAILTMSGRTANVPLNQTRPAKDCLPKGLAESKDPAAAARALAEFKAVKERLKHESELEPQRNGSPNHQ